MKHLLLVGSAILGLGLMPAAEASNPMDHQDAPLRPSANGQEPINLNQDLILTPKQRKTLAVEAMRGSAEAATKISLFYGFVLLNPMEERRWALIAAENGDPVAQYNVYEDFMNNDTALDRERALFWLRKSASAGLKDAQEKLQRVEQEGDHAN